MNRDIDESSENVLSDWSRRTPEPDDENEDEREQEDEHEAPAWGRATAPDPAEAEAVETEAYAEPEPEPEIEEPAEPELPAGDGIEAIAVEPSLEHAAGDLEIPEGYAVLEGDADGGRRAVGVVVARFNGSVTSRLLDRSLEELEAAGVRREAITVMVVPGAFELPLAATALAKTRRFACIVALGCVIRGDTPHFDYVASEAASGLQLAALETGVPVSFGVLTLDRVEQADARIEKGAEAVRSALEMADVFSHLRAAASR
jgi:6,7-dimethyl-8-ribityllumazine synthase